MSAIQSRDVMASWRSSSLYASGSDALNPCALSIIGIDIAAVLFHPSASPAGVIVGSGTPASSLAEPGPHAALRSAPPYWTRPNWMRVTPRPAREPYLAACVVWRR